MSHLFHNLDHINFICISHLLNDFENLTISILFCFHNLTICRVGNSTNYTSSVSMYICDLSRYVAYIHMSISKFVQVLGGLGLVGAPRRNPLQPRYIYFLHFSYFAIPQRANPLHRHCISCNWALETNAVFCTGTTLRLKSLPFIHRCSKTPAIYCT